MNDDRLIEQLARATAALVGDTQGQRFGIAVSGGPDSMALLDLAAGAFPGRVACATVDHGLRPESADEAAMVARWCANRGIDHALLRPESAPDGNVQAWARGVRYALLERWRDSAGIDWLMTAHHADDQIETMLMRLNRGSGVGGLAGVRGRSGRVLRPLLGVRKAALIAHVDARAIPYVHDPSNTDMRFDRAALRTRLAETDWLDPMAAARSAAALAEAEEALVWTTQRIAATHVTQQEDGWAIEPAGLPREILRRLLLDIMGRLDEDAAPRGEALDRIMGIAFFGGKATLGRCLIKGGRTWRIGIAPPRRA